MNIEGGYRSADSWSKSSLAGATHFIRSNTNLTGSEPTTRLVAFSGNNLSGFSIQHIKVIAEDAVSQSVTAYGMHMIAHSDHEPTHLIIIRAGN